MSTKWAANEVSSSAYLCRLEKKLGILGIINTDIQEIHTNNKNRGRFTHSLQRKVFQSGQNQEYSTF
jgi:hypothetical protein